MLFLLALFARVLIAAVVAHWMAVGLVILMGADPDDVADLTAILVVLLVLTTLAGVGAAYRSQPDVIRRRMSAGPRVVAQWRPFVFALGGASEVGGLLIFVSGCHRAGAWAMGIGTAMVVIEVAAIAGAGKEADSK